MTIARSTHSFPLVCTVQCQPVHRIPVNAVIFIRIWRSCSLGKFATFSVCAYQKKVLSGQELAVLCCRSIVCVCASIFHPHKMKKIFSKFEKNEKIESANRETNSYVGKVFTVGRTIVTVEDILAEGNFLFFCTHV